MKQPYLRPTIINADILESTYGIIPFAAIGAAAAASSAAAAASSGIAMMAGYASGRAIAKTGKAIPSFRLPSLVKRKENDCDISMA